MKHADFKIGTPFWTATGAWQCTDVGTRTVAAIRTEGKALADLYGPPYSVVEVVFDENDFEGCCREPFGASPADMAVYDAIAEQYHKDVAKCRGHSDGLHRFDLLGGCMGDGCNAYDPAYDANRRGTDAAREVNTLQRSLYLTDGEAEA